MWGEGRDLSYADKEGLLCVRAGDEKAPVCTCLSSLYKTLIGENMAIQKVRLIRLTWENDDSFIMETNLNGGDWDIVTKMDENSYFADLWPNTEALCKEYFEREMKVIGAEMKA